MKPEEPLDPVEIGGFSSGAVMPDPDGIPNPIEEYLIV